MASALDGITVLDLSTGAAGALAGMFLADHGARVTRIVAPAEAQLRTGGFIVWDRGKATLTLDLDAAVAEPNATAAATLRRLISEADVLLEDFAPSSPRQGLVERAELMRSNPRLVACSITAYGKVGPLKDEPAVDELVLARMGVLGGMPGFRPPPVHVVHPLPSVGAALYAATGIAAALLAREETGCGRAVSTSLMAGALLYHPKVTGERLARHVFQTHPAGSAPFYSLYRCSDGRWVQLGCVHANFIAVAAGLMGLGELITQARFDKGRAPKTPADDKELRGAIQSIIGTRTYPEWAKAFEEADVPYAEARQTGDSLDDPQVLHNAMVVSLEDPALGPVVQMGVPINLTATPGRIQGPRQVPKPAPSASAVQPLDADRRAPHTSDEPSRPPLAGVRILEITNLIAGPTTGRILADLGADVVKLEPHEGDMSRPIGRTYFYSVNFNKRSISIDTRKEAGKQIVRRIAAKADALVANLRPGATERMGITPAVNPRLIETHITGYGFTGPYSHRPGIDPLAQALMGLSRAQGGKDNPPVFPAQLAPTDYTTGAMGALGTILALYARKRSGVVQRVESNLLNGGIVLASAWFTRYAGRPERPLADKEQMGLGPFHRLYKLQDGWIYLVAAAEPQQRAVCEVAGMAWPIAGTAPAADEHSNDTTGARALAAAFAGCAVGETLAALRSRGVACAPALAGDSEIFLGDPHSLANGMVAARSHPTAGRLTVAWQSIQFAGTEPTQGRATPLLGEQSADVMKEVGYAQADIDTLVRDGVVKIVTGAA